MAYPHFSWDIAITATTDDIAVEIDGNGVKVVTLGAGTYRWRGDGNAADLAQEFEDALNAHADIGAGTFTVTLLQTGYLQVVWDQATAVTIQWGHASTNATLAHFGAEATTWTLNAGSSYTATSTFVVGNAWFPNIYEADDRLIPVKIATHFEGIDPQGETAIYGEWDTREIIFEWVTPCRVLQSHVDDSAYTTAEGVDGDDPNIAFENLWDELWDGNAVYYHASGTGSAGAGPYYMWGTRPSLRDWVTVQSPGGTYYRVAVWVKG